MKLFISYRSLDSAQVDAIVTSLASLKNPDGTPRYSAWQDKKGIPPGKDWWEAIVDAIIDCEIFVFHISAEALKSDVCRAELQYARERNRFIIPVVLEGEFWIDTVTGKPNMSYWDQIPAALNEYRTQFLFYKGTAFFSDFEQAVAQYDPRRYRDIERPRPSDPRGGSEASHDSITLYDEACDYAGRLEFGTARKIFQKLIQRADSEFYTEAVEWTEIIGHYERLLAMEAKTSTRFRVHSLWDEYKKLFPKYFFDGVFDPKGFSARFDTPLIYTPSELPITAPLIASESAPPLNLDSVIEDLKAIKKAYLPSSIDLMPEPFEWIEIPAGKVTLEGGGYIAEGGQTFDVATFTIGKYPITNAQYGKFIEAGGYDQKQWWTEAGWAQREQEKWTEPRYWQKEKWIGAEYPVVGVSWYESVAFCQWLSELSGEAIRLATEQEWQRTAQGDKGLTYPWGNEWDKTRCNNSVNEDWEKNRTSPVQQYEGKGNSPYGVADLSGNVWEWCLTGYSDGSQLIDSVTHRRVLRGGSWNGRVPNEFRAALRYGYTPGYGNSNYGFRCVRSS